MRRLATGADSPLLDRVLAIIANRVENGPLPGLREALNLVTERAPKFRQSPESLVHMDYHPQNVMVRGSERDRRDRLGKHRRRRSASRRGDDRGDPVVVRAGEAAMDARQRRRQRLARELRGIVHAALSRDGADGFERFRYCQAVAALLRLSMLGMMRARGPEIVGFRREAIEEVTPAVVRLLSRYATRKSGASVRLDAPAPQPA